MFAASLLVCLIICSTSVLAELQIDSLPIRLPVVTSRELCSSAEVLEDAQNIVASYLRSQSPRDPVPSCASLPPSSPSGYYSVRTSNGSAVRVYCDMTRSCGGVTGGWMRVAELDMTNSSHQCPSGLGQRNDSNLRICLRDSSPAGCSSVMLSTFSVNYSSVCGRIIGYQIGSTDALHSRSIDSNYVEGVSLTHGIPREHIWTFASALDELVSESPVHSCPCIQSDLVTRNSAEIPAFLNNDYFCDTGSHDQFQIGEFYSADPLWDGAGCGPQSTCCSFNNPPWFYKELPQTTTDDIEMRVCRDQESANEDVAIEIVDVYIR